MSASAQQNFQEVLQVARNRVQEYLDRADEVIAEIAHTAPSGVSERMGKLVLRKGKKIRSTLLCLLASSGESKPDMERVAHACAGIELLHLASLVHDDIIDETELRRGEQTAHMEWGNKIAVLIGDYILSQAMRCVVDEPARSIPIILSSAADQLIVGEISELDCSGNLNLSYDRYVAVISGKTAALVDACARIGATLAGHGKELVEECGKMGIHYGIAFQIIDDLLDYGFGAKDLDKAKFTDVANGLVTLPLIFFFNQCNADDRKTMENLIAHAVEPHVPQEIVNLMKRYNCFEKAKENALSHLDSAIAISKKLPGSEYMDTLTAFFFSMSDRNN